MKSISVCCSENVLAELESKKRKLLRKLAVDSLVLVREVCTSADEALVVVLEKSHLVLIKTKLVLLLINRLHPLEKVIVKRHIHRILCKHRRDLLCDLLLFIIGMCLHHSIEDACHLAESLAGILHSLDCVLECRLLLICYDCIDLSLSLCDTLLECWKVVFILDLVELRSTERRRRLCQKRILHVATDKCKRCACDK